MFRKFFDRIKYGKRSTAGLEKYLQLMSRDDRDMYRRAFLSHPEIARRLISDISQKFAVKEMSDDERLQVAMEVLRSAYDRIQRASD